MPPAAAEDTGDADDNGDPDHYPDRGRHDDTQHDGGNGYCRYYNLAHFISRQKKLYQLSNFSPAFEYSAAHDGAAFLSLPDCAAVPQKNQIVRDTSKCRIWLIAYAGERLFGQTSVQFMMVRQRNRRYASSRSSSRALMARSRLSAIKR